MQYKVPQNIDLEDKIVGPFTMKQFLYLLVGGSICYGWWNYASTFISPSPVAVFLPVGGPVGILAFCLALVKINDRPFEFFILNMFKFLFSPKQRKWIEGYQPENVITLDKISAQDAKNKPSKDIRGLDDLAKGLEQKNINVAPAPQPSKISEPPKPVNVAVNDVQGAAEKQQGAQRTEVGGQRVESGELRIRNQELGIRNQKSETNNQTASPPAIKKSGLFGFLK